MQRRDFLKIAVAGAGALAAPLDAALATQQTPAPKPAPAAAPAASPTAAAAGKPDYSLHMGPTIVEVSPYEMVSTTGYDGQSPGPLLKMKEGVRTTVEFVNETDVPEVVHWHGLLVPAEVDGAVEENTPTVPPHSSRRYTFIAKP